MSIEFHVARYDDDTTKPEKLIYPDGTVVLYNESEGRLDMSGLKDHIGKTMELHSNGKFISRYKIKNFYYNENNIGTVSYEPIK